MQRKNLIITLIGILVVGFVLATTIKQKTGGNVVRFGSILVLSGDYKSMGEQVRDGQILAMDEINAVPNIKRKVEVIFYDSQDQKEIALEKVKTLNRDGIRYVSEIFGSTPASYCLPYISQHNMLFVSGVDTGPALTKEGGKTFFRIIPPDNLACQQLSRRALDMGNKKAAVVFINDKWGSGLRSEFQAEFLRLGGEITTTIETGKGQDFFQPVVASIKAKKPQLVLLFVYPREAALLVKEARRQRLNAAFMGTDNLTGSEVAEVAGDDIQGVMFVVPRPREVTERAKHFNTLYKQKFGSGKEPPLFSTLGYDVIHLLAKVIEESGEDVDRAVQQLERIKHQGATGPISFDESHELRVSNYQLKAYKKVDGKLVAQDYQQDLVTK